MENKSRKRLSALVVAAGVVALWRGLWVLMDLHLLPDHPTGSAFASLGIGLILLLATEQLVKQWL